MATEQFDPAPTTPAEGDPGAYNLPVITQFRENGGKVGPPFEGAKIVLITTRGAKSGEPRTVPTLFFAQPDGSLLVFGSNGGADTHPAWYHNVRAHPGSPSRTARRPTRPSPPSCRRTARSATASSTRRPPRSRHSPTTRRRPRAGSRWSCSAGRTDPVRYTLLGRTGVRISRLALGTMTFGDEWKLPEATRAGIFERYAEAGGNVIDTANEYGGGSAETALGKLLAGRRDQFVLSTKYTMQMLPGDLNSAGNHRKNLVRSLEGSLRRLGTDHIDMLWVHARDTLTPVPEVMRALDDQVRAGKVLYVGVSDWPAWEVAQANTLAELRDWSPFAGLQIRYNLLERTVERELLPMAHAFDLPVFAWGRWPTGGSPASTCGPRTVGWTTWRGARAVRGGDDVVEETVRVAGAAGRSPAQVALAWLLSRPGNVVPILGATKEEQLADNLGAVDVVLEDEWLAALDRASRVDAGSPTTSYASPRCGTPSTATAGTRSRTAAPRSAGYRRTTSTERRSRSRPASPRPSLTWAWASRRPVCRWCPAGTLAPPFGRTTPLRNTSPGPVRPGTPAGSRGSWAAPALKRRTDLQARPAPEDGPPTGEPARPVAAGRVRRTAPYGPTHPPVGPPRGHTGTRTRREAAEPGKVPRPAASRRAVPCRAVPSSTHSLKGVQVVFFTFTVSERFTLATMCSTLTRTTTPLGMVNRSENSSSRLRPWYRPPIRAVQDRSSSTSSLSVARPRISTNENGGRSSSHNIAIRPSRCSERPFTLSFWQV